MSLFVSAGIAIALFDATAPLTTSSGYAAASAAPIEDALLDLHVGGSSRIRGTGGTGALPGDFGAVELLAGIARTPYFPGAQETLGAVTTLGPMAFQYQRARGSSSLSAGIRTWDPYGPRAFVRPFAGAGLGGATTTTEEGLSFAGLAYLEGGLHLRLEGVTIGVLGRVRWLSTREHGIDGVLGGVTAGFGF